MLQHVDVSIHYKLAIPYINIYKLYTYKTIYMIYMIYST